MTNNKGGRGKRSPDSLRLSGVRLPPVRPDVAKLLDAIATLRGGTKASHIENALAMYAKSQGVQPMKSVYAENFSGVWNNEEITSPFGDRREKIEFDPNNPVSGFSVASTRFQELRLETEIFELSDGRYLWKCQQDPTGSMDKPGTRYEVHSHKDIPKDAREIIWV